MKDKSIAKRNVKLYQLTMKPAINKDISVTKNSLKLKYYTNKYDNFQNQMNIRSHKVSCYLEFVKTMSDSQPLFSEIQ